MRHRVHFPFSVLLSVFLCGLQIAQCDIWDKYDPEGNRRIFTVWSGAQEWNDYKFDTAHTLPEEEFASVSGTLDAVYNISLIQITLESNDASLFSKPFNIYTYPRHINPCLIEQHRVWNLCTKDAMLTKSGEVVRYKCAPEAVTAQYVMISHGSSNSTQRQLGPTISEITIYGAYVDDATMSPEPEQGELNRYHEPRKNAFAGVTKWPYEPSYAQLVFDWNSLDVVMAWDDKRRIAAMYYPRGKGHVLVMIGRKWMDEMLTPPYNSNFALNLKHRLAENECNMMVKANETYLDGDVLLVSRDMSFDVLKIQNSIQSGKNLVVISFLGSAEKNPNDNTWELLKKLKITVKLDDVVQDVKVLDPDSLINSLAFIPNEYDVKWRVSSWNGLCSRPPRIHCVNIDKGNRAVATSPEFQKDVRDILERYRTYFEDRAPCNKNPAKPSEETKQCWINYNLYALCQLTSNPIALYGTDIFPGRVSNNERPVTHRVKYTPRFGGYYQPLGVYVNPGDAFSWKILNSTTSPDNFRFTFSCFKDGLQKLSSWKRWPYHQHGLELTSTGSYATPMGGVLFLRMLKDTENITIELNNVYRHPWFDLLDESSINGWEEERKRYSGVPWMALAGDNFHACLETKYVTQLSKDDILYSSTYFDNTIKMMHNIRGSSWEGIGAEVFATDIQLSVGWGHSGIPVMGHLPWVTGFTDVPNIKKQSAIGMTHEFGHNIQNGAATFSGGTEVTNNVYHFFVRGHLCNLTAYVFGVQWAFSWGDVDGIIQAWKGTTFGGINLGYYNWLGLTFGEGLLVNLWRAMTENSQEAKSMEGKASVWLRTMCSETQYNILPWHELFHFPINDAARTECQKYKCFFPDDALTQKIPQFVEHVIANVTGGCDRIPKKQVESKYDIFYGLFTKRSQWIYFV